MRPTLPSAFLKIRAACIILGVTAAVGCSKPLPPVEPGPPIAADPPMKLRGMVEECDAMTTALQSFETCPNLEKDDQKDLEAWIDRARKDFAAGRKANPEPNAQQAIALACHRAAQSVEAAHERCLAGPRPKDT